jgi:hypothetical protein
VAVVSGMDPQIARMVHEARVVRPEYRPAVMEATIRGGANKAVLEAFDATADERDRVDELLAKPSIWRTI